MVTRVAKYGIVDFGGDRAEVSREWSQLCRYRQEILNLCTNWWIAWHEFKGTGNSIRKYLETPKEERGKPDFRCIPSSEEVAEVGWLLEGRNGKVGAKSFYRVASKLYEHVLNSQAIIPITKDFQDRISKLPGTNIKVGWWEVLLGTKAPPFYSRADKFDIPAGKKLFSFTSDGKDWFANLTPNPGGKTYRVKIRCQGKNVRSEIEKLEQMIVGELDLRMVTITKDRKGKWFLYLCYKLPELEPMSDSKIVGIVRATNDPRQPLIIECQGKTRWIVGEKDQRTISYQRDRILYSRRARQKDYRNKTTSRSGHGRKRAMQSCERFRTAWPDFTTNLNREFAKQAVRWAKVFGCGRIEFQQPGADDDVVLGMGEESKHMSDDDRTRWPWYQLGKFIEERARKERIFSKVVAPKVDQDTKNGDRKRKPKEAIEL